MSKSKPGNNTRDMEKLASIVDTLQGDHYIKGGCRHRHPPSATSRDLASSFKEAQIAMEVGKVFDTERQVVSYDHLGIARLIYQLPTTPARPSCAEVFKSRRALTVSMLRRCSPSSASLKTT